MRVTVASCAGFYPAVYVFDAPVAALYALFAPIALGVLSPLPGSGSHRARVVLRVLPLAVALTALGTALAVATAPAVAGMVVVGFTLSFGAACGPAPAGVAPGLQLFYILACFPPYAPDTLPQRLVGPLTGGVLLALCEVLVLPAPPDVTYRERVAAALDVAARAARAAAGGRAAGPGLVRELRAAGQALRLSRLPPAVRPAGAGRTDRALAHTGAATRRLLDQLARGAQRPAPAPDTASVALLSGIGAECAAMAANLRGRRPVPGPEALEEMVEQFLTARGRAAEAGEPPPADVLRWQSAVLAEAASAVVARAALSIALGGRRRVRGLPHEQLWYAQPSAATLWLRRLAGNLTPRSVVLQNAVRTALGLAAARLVTGSLDLSHGFWVLLAVLTLGRTTAGATWSAVRSAAAGTLVGALAAGVLILWAGEATYVYAALLVPTMVLTFTVGPVAGVAWTQGLFTLVVSTAFAQLAPVSWRLGEARVVDVLTGCGIGLLCGVLAWPAGAATEVRRAMARLLREAAPLIPATVAEALPSPAAPAAEPPDARERMLWRARQRLRLAEAAYAQYRSEPAAGRHDRAPGGHTGGPDWPAALNWAVHVLVGAHWLPRYPAHGEVPAPAARWAREAAGSTAAAAVRAAGFPPGGVRAARTRLPSSVEREVPGPVLPVLIDVEHWLATLAAELEAIGGEDSDSGVTAPRHRRPHGPRWSGHRRAAAGRAPGHRRRPG